jgi:hypothetical protein
MNPRVSHDGPRGDEAWSALSLQDPRYSYSLERGLAILKVGRLSLHSLSRTHRVRRSKVISLQTLIRGHYRQGGIGR